MIGAVRLQLKDVFIRVLETEIIIYTYQVKNDHLSLGEGILRDIQIAVNVIIRQLTGLGQLLEHGKISNSHATQSHLIVHDR